VVHVENADGISINGAGVGDVAADPLRGLGLAGQLRRMEQGDRKQPFVFHGNRYNRNVSEMPARTNAGPCKRTQQFDHFYRRSFKNTDADIFRVMSDEICEVDVEERGKDQERDEGHATKKKAYPTFRARPDSILSLFTVKYDFDFRAGRLLASAWRYNGGPLPRGGIAAIPPGVQDSVALPNVTDRDSGNRGVAFD